MTVMQAREIAMTSPSVKKFEGVINKTASRISNFSVASLLADTKSHIIETPKNLSLNKSDLEPCDDQKISEHERKSHCSSVISEQDFDEEVHDEDDDDCDSIVDVEDIKSDKSTNSYDAMQSQSLTSKPLIRPTPFSAIAAAWGLNNLQGWPANRQLQLPFRSPEFFPGQSALLNGSM